MEKPYVIAVDLGGTRMRVALFDQQHTLLERVEAPTHAPEGPGAVVPRLLDLIDRVCSKYAAAVAGIGVSSPGPINPFSGYVVSPPNLHDWENIPLTDIIRDRFALPAFLENDANLAALAEAHLGAARGHKHAIYVTVSTGIGGGVIIDGRVYQGAQGLAGEIGFMTVVGDDGEITILERVAAGPALARKAVARIQAGADSQIVALVGGDLSQVTGAIVGQAAVAGDPVALAVVEEGGRLVGCGIVTLMHLFNPTIFVIGGGVTRLGDLLFAPIKQAVRDYAMDPAYWKDVPIVPAGLGEDVCLVGAAIMTRQQLEDGART